MLIVQMHITFEILLQTRPTVEAMRGQHPSDPAFEALRYAIGLRRLPTLDGRHTHLCKAVDNDHRWLLRSWNDWEISGPAITAPSLRPGLDSVTCTVALISVLAGKALFQEVIS